MNYKRLFKKSTIIYIIIILSLAILFNNSNKQNNINNILNSNTEGFSTKDKTPLEIIIPIYEEEKENYINLFIYGEEIFNSILDISIITEDNIDTLIEPSELADLAVNITSDIEIFVNNAYKKIEELQLKEIDNYLNNEYIKEKEKLYSNYDYPNINIGLDKEITSLLINKINKVLENSGNSKNFKIEEEFSNNLIGLDKLNKGLTSKIGEIEEDEKLIEMTRKLTYVITKLDDDKSEDDLKKILSENFYNPISTFPLSSSITIPSVPLTTTTTLTNPKLPIPKSFDGLSNEELEIIKRNQIANTPQNINTILIDPLKAVETVQDDILGLLETFSNKEKSSYLNRQFDPTNRGSYLINSPTDDLVVNKIDNLSYYSSSVKPEKIISPKEKILDILSNKENRTLPNELRNNFPITNQQIEGFEDNNQSTTMNIFDGFIKYSSSSIISLINKLTSGSIDINSIDNNKLQSYGIIIIVIAILFFFISSSN
jgi:hypothetical protein